MKTIKKGLLLLSLVLSIFMIIPKTTVSAATKASGSCGPSASWTLTDDGVLTISGTGEMTSSPWTDNYKTAIKTVVISKGIKNIYKSAFAYCSSLTSIKIPNSVTSIDSRAFSDCKNLTSIVVDIKNSTYDSRNNCNAIIRKKDNSLIVGCISTIIPNSVTSIGEYAFNKCYGLTSIEIPNGVTSIGNYAFWECYGLTSIEIPNSVTSIGDIAFYACEGLTSIEIPNSVTSIGEYAFCGCSGLTSIEIPNSVTSIGEAAFWYCSGLTSITFESSTLPAIGKNCFYQVKTTGIFRVPEGTSEKEKNKLSGKGVTIDADHWKIEYFTPVTGVTLNKTATQLMVASSETLTATVAPANATDKSVSWSSSDTSVATVDAAGKVTAVGAGTTIITVKTTSERKTATCIVTVEATHSWDEGKVTLEATTKTEGVADDGTIIAGIQSISLNKENFTYTGKAIKAKVIVTDANGNVLSSDNYDLKYSKPLKNVGTKSVTITFKGSYSGSKTLRYNVIPKNVSKIKVKKGSKAITVSWKKQSKQTSGYQIEYSTKKNFKNAKRITIKNTKKTKTSIKSIKTGKKYYVRIRTYKKVGSGKYYSTWSKVKKVK